MTASTCWPRVPAQSEHPARQGLERCFRIGPRGSLSTVSFTTALVYEGGRSRMALFGRSKRVRAIQRVPLFASCSMRELSLLAGILDEVSVPAGRVLIKRGDFGKEFLLLLEGTVTVEPPTGKRVRMGHGDFFGEMSLLDGEPRSATVTAETPVRLLAMGQREFYTLLAEVPSVARKLLVELSRRVRRAEASVSA